MVCAAFPESKKLQNEPLFRAENVRTARSGIATSAWGEYSYAAEPCARIGVPYNGKGKERCIHLI